MSKMPEAQTQNNTSKISSLMNIQYVWFLGHLTTGKENLLKTNRNKNNKEGMNKNKI